MKGKYNLCSVAHMPEATNLIEAMIQQNDAQRWVVVVAVVVVIVDVVM